MTDKIWAYFIMLSDHFAYDELGGHERYYLGPSYQRENRIDMEVWDSTIAFLAEHQYNTVLVDVGDQVLYESHPEISAPNAFSKEFVRQKLSEIRALGMTPIPKLNFSACHHVWLHEYNRMLGTPTYYKVCADLIAEVCELFDNPPLFHLGLDEENFDCQYGTTEKVLIRGEKLWWHDLYFYFNEVEKHGARPWVWSDYFWHHPELFLKYMPKSVLQSNWFYGAFKDYGGLSALSALPDSGYIGTKNGTRVRQEAYDRLDLAGYDEVPTCSSINGVNNPVQTLYYCRDHVSDEHLKGFMTASWRETSKRMRYALLNDAWLFHEGRAEVFPESL